MTALQEEWSEGTACYMSFLSFGMTGANSFVEGRIDGWENGKLKVRENPAVGLHECGLYTVWAAVCQISYAYPKDKVNVRVETGDDGKVKVCLLPSSSGLTLVFFMVSLLYQVTDTQAPPELRTNTQSWAAWELVFEEPKAANIIRLADVA